MTRIVCLIAFVAGCTGGTVKIDTGTPRGSTLPSTSLTCTVGESSTVYPDLDGDGYGDEDKGVEVCPGDEPSGYIAKGEDCDDSDPTVHPGVEELCDLVDNNCFPADDLVEVMLFDDLDGDSYGDPYTGRLTCDVTDPGTPTSGDCDDSNADIHPFATETCDGLDDDCDTVVPADEVDGDVDGFLACEDCNDANAAISPAAVEICADGIDNDCNALTTEVDGDGDGFIGCGPDADCDDTNPLVNPGAQEVCDGGTTDEDCNGLADDEDPGTLVASKFTIFHDADGDGQGDPNSATLYCKSPDLSWIGDNSDCNDNDASIYLGAPEACNGIDDDCDLVPDNGLATTTYFADNDADGFGDPTNMLDACAQPPGYLVDASDCNDADPSINPNGYEIKIVDVDADGVYDSIDDHCGDGQDNDCDGAVDEAVECGDGDNDGVENAIDMVVMKDGDGDGLNDTECVVADATFTMPSPNDGFSAVAQGDEWGGFASLNGPAASLIGIDRDGDGVDEVSGWCLDFIANPPAVSGNWNWRFVSEVAADGVAIAPAACNLAMPSTTWVPMDLADYCAVTGDPACGYGAFFDGCGNLVGDEIRTYWDASSQSIDNGS